MGGTIKGVHARQVLDSRGNPTVEVDVILEEGYIARAIVPSGASTGKYEALELRDGKKPYLGKSVMNAVYNVNKTISKNLIGKRPENQAEIDNIMLKLDGTPNKSKLGANAILGVSMAVCRAGAFSAGIPLYKHIGNIAGNKRFSVPVPYANVINGGKHAGSKLEMQEFMIVPIGAKNFADATRYTVEVYQTLKKILIQGYGKSSANVGDEGGFAPALEAPEEALGLLEEAIKEAGYEKEVKIAMDPAASEFFHEGTYLANNLTKEQMVDYYLDLIKKYPIISLEDPFDQDDFESYARLTKSVKKSFQVVGDDLLVSNVERIKIGLKKKLCNALLLKVNQIGSVTEAINAANLALKNNWHVMVSHRSGETEDPFIADLVVGLNTKQIKIGAPCRSDRTSKYNQLLRIEEELK
jgi:enolase